MEKTDDSPEDVKRATSVDRELKRGQKDDTFEGYPRIVEKKKRWEHCDKGTVKKSKQQKEDSNGGCCQKRRKERAKKSAKFAMVTVLEKPCTLPKVDIIPRHCLTKEKYISLLATAREKCPPDVGRKIVLRRLKPVSPRIKELAQPKRHRMLITLQEGASILPPALLDNLVRTVENETCLTPEQAATIARKKKLGGKKKRGRKDKWQHKETTKSKKSSIGAASTGSFDKDSVCCQYLMAERFVRSILKWKCSLPKSEFSDVAEVIVRRLVAVLEYTLPQNEDRKSQQLRYLADVIACWVTGVLSEVAQSQEEKLLERCRKKEEELWAEEEEETEEEEEEEDKDKKEDRAEYEEEDEEHEPDLFSEEEAEMVDEETVIEGMEVEEEAEAMEAEEEEEVEEVVAELEEEETEVELAVEMEVETQVEPEAQEVEVQTQLEAEAEAKLAAEAAEADAIAQAEAEAEAKAEAEAAAEAEAEAEAVAIAIAEAEAEDEAAAAAEAEAKAAEEAEAEAAAKAAAEAEAEEYAEDAVTVSEETVIPADEEEVELTKEVEEKIPSRVEDMIEKEIPKEVDVIKGLEELLRTELPFLTFDKIIDTIYKMIESTPENTGEDPITNGIHRAIYEKLSNIVMLEDPDLLTEELKTIMDVVCGKIANWLRSILTKSQIAFMEQYVPEVESKEIRDWTKWLAYISDVANDWNVWLRSVIEKIFEMESEQVTRGEWQDWTKSVDTKALLWRRFHLQTLHQAQRNATMMIGRRVVKTGRKGAISEPSEQLINTTDLQA